MGSLTKTYNTSFTYGSPGRPAIPPYSHQQCDRKVVIVSKTYTTSIKGEWWPEIDDATGEPTGISIFHPAENGSVTIVQTEVKKEYEVVLSNCRTVLVPGEEAIPPVPAAVNVTALIGWTGGARSSESIPYQGRFRFSVPRGVVGVMVGWSVSDVGTDYAELTHAIYFHKGEFEIYEDGKPAGPRGTYNDSDIFELRRCGHVVTYHREVSS